MKLTTKRDIRITPSLKKKQILHIYNGKFIKL